MRKNRLLQVGIIPIKATLGHVDTVGKGRVKGTGRLGLAYVKRDSQWEAAVQRRKLGPGLCDDLERWDGVGR